MPWRPERDKQTDTAIYKKLLRSPRWLQLKRLVLAVEDDCSVCNRPVDKTLKGNHPDGPNIDHEQPFKERPDLFFDRSNVRLTHKKCNASRMHGTRRESWTEHND